MEIKYAVRGLSCGSCLVELMEGVRSVAGVEMVTVDMVRDGTSSLTVHARVPLAVGTVPAVVRSSGFWLWADERLDDVEVSG